MKKIIGIALLVLFFGGFAVGVVKLLRWYGLSRTTAILVTLGAYVTAALIVGFACLVSWLLT